MRRPSAAGASSPGSRVAHVTPMTPVPLAVVLLVDRRGWLLLQEREAAEQLRGKNMSMTDELQQVRAELANVKRALMTESEAHSATIRNLSSMRR